MEPIQLALQHEIHHELLIRLEDKDDSTIPPGAFLPAAERYNLVVEIDKWVLKALFDYLTSYPGLWAELGVCSINLSRQSLADPDFLEYVVSTLGQSRIATERICFEITETAAISNLAIALKFVNRLKELGCHFALDDFGCGLSSFAYLKALPVDYLKIDGIFVKDIVSDPADYAIVKSIHEIGRALGKTTIAGFVEGDNIERALTVIGVDFAQGYGVRPAPAT
jgi:EAL domain-containing protein (putative c-di-GMP-specific phosphodiesterase class I)